MEKKNILIMSNSPNLSFGYSIVFKEVAEALADAGHNVYYLGMQTYGPPTKYNNYTLLGMGYDRWGKDVLASYLKSFKIDIFISGLDLWMDCVSYIKETMDKLKNIFWIAHITINSSPLSPLLYRNINTAGAFIAPSKYVEKELNRTPLGVRTKYIPHFVDTDFFKPNKEAGDKIKKALGLEDKFVFLAVMRNRDMHKNPGALMKALSRCISSDKEMGEKVKLLFITDPIEPVGVNLLTMTAFLHLNDYIVFPKVKFEGEDILIASESDPKHINYNTFLSISRKGMSDVYNACDVHINTSSGESFGLPTLESMSCGKPQICNIETTGRELVESSKAGIAVDSACTQMQSNFSEILLIDEVKLAKAMYDMFHADDYNEFSANAIKKAKEYEKKEVLDMWVNLINDSTDHINEFSDKIDYFTGRTGL